MAEKKLGFSKILIENERDGGSNYGKMVNQ